MKIVAFLLVANCLLVIGFMSFWENSNENLDEIPKVNIPTKVRKGTVPSNPEQYFKNRWDSKVSFCCKKTEVSPEMTKFVSFPLLMRF
jgi:hypothetical protein